MYRASRALAFGSLVVLVSPVIAHFAAAEVIDLHAKDTLSALEMEHGDELRFRLQNGRVFNLVLEDTHAAVVERVTPGGIVYRFSAEVRVDGQFMILRRYVCCQECFYEPYVVNGVRIWLDTVKDVFDLIPIRYPRKGNLQCLPRKSARLAIQDATLRICPPELQPWIEDDRDRLDAGECYNGDDCYLGPYLGQACHVGMDVNHPKGSVLSAPFDFDTHAYFNSLAMGHNNNRWRGIRRWDNGDVWALQTHHLIDLLVPENQPLKSGTRYATTAGVHVGSHQHTHFEFKIGRPRDLQDAKRQVDQPASIAAAIDFDDESDLAQERPEVLHLDPWIVFWQTFEDRRTRRGEMRAAMEPVGPGRTGRPVTFKAVGAEATASGNAMECYWAFDDGGFERGPTATHVFAYEGVYPVTLVVDDGTRRTAATQHVTISDGGPPERPVLSITSPDEPAFYPRSIDEMDVYGHSPVFLPRTLYFLARPSRLAPRVKALYLDNEGPVELAVAGPPKIEYETGGDWLHVVRRGRGDEQELLVSVDAKGLAVGKYAAFVQVSCSGAVNSPQSFCVELQVTENPPSRAVIVDDRDPGFYATPYFWVGHRFCRCPADRRGYGGFYLTNGGRPLHGEYARFTPDLEGGRYDVSLVSETPFQPGVEFDVLIQHARGDQVVRVRPEESRTIGTFEFDEGRDGFVEILAGKSKGLVIADAVRFVPD